MTTTDGGTCRVRNCFVICSSAAKYSAMFSAEPPQLPRMMVVTPMRSLFSAEPSRITAIGRLEGSGAREIDARGRYVAPGFIESPMTDALNEQQKAQILSTIPSGRLGAGADVAAACAYLASDEAGYITGQTLHVNGGMAMI